MTRRFPIHRGPAYEVDLVAEPSAGDLVAITFETRWPTARKPERVKRLRLQLSQDELYALACALGTQLRVGVAR